MLAPLVTLALVAAAPVADVWPWAVKPLPDGALEYRYDLSALKASKGTPDAVEAHGEEAVRAFLTSLPSSATVRVARPPGLEASAGRGLEWGAMAVSFAQVGDGPYTADNPLARRPAAKLRQPFDPDEPKLLPPVEAFALAARRIEDAALLGVEADTDRLRVQLLTRAATAALKRDVASEGEAREGARALAARLYAAWACLDASKLASLHLSGEVAAAASAELTRLASDVDAKVAPVPWSRSEAATCAWVRARALAQPFEESRAGTSAVLTWLALRRADAKLAALDAQVRRRRDRYVGAPGVERLDGWAAKAGDDVEGALDDLGGFIESLSVGERVPPPLFAAPRTPFMGFFAQLEGAARASAMEELAAAVQDARVSPATGPDAPWPVLREAALAALASDATRVRFDGGWAGRLRVAFAALQVAHLDGRGEGLDLAPPSRERSDLTVRLRVPPDVEVEPLPEAYARLAASLARLAKQLSEDGLSRLAPDASRWSARLEGLAALAASDAPRSGPKVAEARRLLARWRAEAAHDVRQASASPLSGAGERQHAAVVGVSRREVVVGFATPPTLDVVGHPAGLVAEAAEQRYLVPVLVTVGGSAPAARPVLDERSLKTALDAVGRDATRAEGAFAEALQP